METVNNLKNPAKVEASVEKDVKRKGVKTAVKAPSGEGVKKTDAIGEPSVAAQTRRLNSRYLGNSWVN